MTKMNKKLIFRIQKELLKTNQNKQTKNFYDVRCKNTQFTQEIQTLTRINEIPKLSGNQENINWNSKAIYIYTYYPSKN